MIAAWRALTGAVIAVVVGVAAPPALATPPASEPSLPTVELSVEQAEREELIDVTISGFNSRVVTVTVCGNDALRGSGDCNMAASESTRINDDGSPRYVRLIVSPPPVPCPCLIRVSSPTNDQAAVAPISIKGHPVAPLVAAAQPNLPLVVAIRASRAADGLADALRTSLGGPTTYDLTITIRNTATETVDDISISATAGRRQRQVLVVADVTPPPAIAAGATWEETVRVELPAPVWGDVRWSADVSDRDNAVVAVDTTNSLPVLLIVAVGVLLLVALALSIRLVSRVRNRRRDVGLAGEGADGVHGPDATIQDHGASPDTAWAGAREYESV